MPPTPTPLHPIDAARRLAHTCSVNFRRHCCSGQSGRNVKEEEVGLARAEVEGSSDVCVMFVKMSSVVHVNLMVCVCVYVCVCVCVCVFVCVYMHHALIARVGH